PGHGRTMAGETNGETRPTFRGAFRTASDGGPIWTTQRVSSPTDRTSGSRSDERRTTMQAQETIEIVDATDTRARGACLVSGSPCKDSRIVSYRRGAFFAAVS